MRAVLRLDVMAFGGRACARADAARSPRTRPRRTSDTPATDAVGPRELQNFSLNGTVTRAADQPRRSGPRAAACSRRRRPTIEPAPATTVRAAATQRHARSAASAATDRRSSAPPPTRSGSRRDRTQRRLSAHVIVGRRPSLPPLGNCAGRRAAAPALRPLTTISRPQHELRCSGRGCSQRSRSAPAAPSCSGATARARPSRAGRRFDAFIAPEPTPTPRPRPARRSRLRRRAPNARRRQSLGIVSTRLRPWIEIGFQPASLHRRGRQGHLRVRAGAVQLGQRPGARRPGRSQHVQRRPEPGAGSRPLSSPTGRARASASRSSRRSSACLRQDPGRSPREPTSS